MPRERALPTLVVRFGVDDKQLKAIHSTAGKTGAVLKKGLGTGKSEAELLEKRLGTLSSALMHLGPAGLIAGNALDQFGRSAADISKLGVVGGVAVGGLVAIAGAALYAESRYEALVTRIDNYQDVTGSSAEQASRMVHTLDVLGVSGETAEKAMFKLSKTISENPDKLRELGIEVQKDAQGNVDLTETLYSVSDAYAAASDSSAKTAILFAAFGKGGAAMIDVVERGSDSLRKLAASASLVVTDADIARLREYKIHQAQLKSGWDEWVASLGQQVVPILDSAVSSMNRQEYVTRRLNEAYQKGTLSYQDYYQASRQSETAGNGIVKTLRAEYDASQAQAAVNAKLSATIKEQTDKNNALVQSMNDVIGGLEAEHNSAFALTRADLAVKESQDKIADAQIRARDAGRAQAAAQTDANLAIKQYGYNSAQAQSAIDALNASAIAARQAADDVARAELDQEQAYYAAAAAARKLQEDTDKATTGQQDATKETRVYIDTLQAEANSLAEGSPLRKRLQAYIDKLRNDIPSNIYTVLHVGLEGHPGKALDDMLNAIPRYAAGGNPPVGRDVWVGEEGPERVRFMSPAHVYPTGQAPAPIQETQMSTPDTWINVVQDQPIILDGAEVGRIINRRIVKASRAYGAV